MVHTKEEKKEYFKQLREKWKANKAIADNSADIRTQYEIMVKESPDRKIGFYSFAYTLNSMKEQNLEGLPYIDCKTFDGWKKAGFKVKKGEHAKVEGITWIKTMVSDKKDDEDATEYMYPKVYKLFHKTQVEPIN